MEYRAHFRESEKTRGIVIRFAIQDYDLLKALAKAEKVSMAQYMRFLVREKGKDGNGQQSA